MKRYIKPLLYSFVLMLAFTLAACQKQPTWQEQYDLGMRYLTESNYEEAIMAFTKAIEIEPGHTDSYIYLIQAYLSEGNPEDAELVRASGYEATGDQRLSHDVSGGWIFYDSSVPLEQRVTYRDFKLLSDAQQGALQRFIAALTEQDIETLWDIEQGVELPIQLDTIADGYLIEFSSINNRDFPEYYLTWLEYFTRQNGENLMAELQEDPYVGLERMFTIEIRPENGNGYAYSGIQNMVGTDGEVLVVLQRTDSMQIAACKDWQYDGPWNAYAEMLHTDGTEQRASTRIEVAGTAEQGEKSTDTTRIITYMEEGRSVQEFQNGNLTAYYMISSDGERVDMMEMMRGMIDSAEKNAE